MPLVGPSPVSGIQFENRGAPLADMLGRMWDKGAEPLRESLLSGIVEMILTPEEHDLVACDARLDFVNQRRGQINRKEHIADFGTDIRR
ncbi:hypothetical protein HDIA_P0113 (plasmid) [Hartmannibacter diazotrophicus]|uniref:Uncharacterized protein n=1 Tax=Hartmannibacter diazotrophicus TaxID=1482074 RepID=A0A2C9DDW4_9HYPH|nr:hypothetical protein HDIA_P0113 [Hartmannibacter diazotrophicus]